MTDNRTWNCPEKDDDGVVCDRILFKHEIIRHLESEHGECQANGDFKDLEDRFPGYYD